VSSVRSHHAHIANSITKFEFAVRTGAQNLSTDVWKTVEKYHNRRELQTTVVWLTETVSGNNWISSISLPHCCCLDVTW
jgi:hypothetical protein